MQLDLQKALASQQASASLSEPQSASESVREPRDFDGRRGHGAGAAQTDAFWVHHLVQRAPESFRELQRAPMDDIEKLIQGFNFAFKMKGMWAESAGIHLTW